MARGRRRLPTSGSANAKQVSESAAAVDGEKMEVDHGQVVADSDSEDNGEDEHEEAGGSVADRVRRRRVRPANLVACEGDILAAVSANFVPPLESHSRPFAVFEALSDVQKGCGQYEVKIFRESQTEREWTSVTGGKSRRVIAEGWQTCSVNAQCVGTKKIRITALEQSRILQRLGLQVEVVSDHNSDSDEHDGTASLQPSKKVQAAAVDSVEVEMGVEDTSLTVSEDEELLPAAPAKRRRKVKASPGATKQKGAAGCPSVEVSESDEDKPLRSPPAKRRKGPANTGSSPKKAKPRRAKAGMVEPRPNVPCIDADATFSSKTQPVAGGKDLGPKDVIRAVIIKDYKLLRDLVADKEHIYTLLMTRSVSTHRNGVEYAIDNNDVEALTIFAQYFNSQKLHRCEAPKVALEMMGSGSVGMATFGHAVRTVGAARGGRELQNAMLADTKERFHDNLGHHEVREALMSSPTVTPATLDRAITLGFTADFLLGGVYIAARCGNRRTAAHILKKSKNLGADGFNFLHVQAVSLDEADFDKFMRISVTKKPYGNQSIRPAHLAAINPNPKYLKALMDVVADYFIADDDRWCPIHYAAVCEGPGPLEYLISRGVDLLAQTKSGETPLMLAAKTGRRKNVDVLLNTDKDVISTMVTIKDASGNTALHHAVFSGQADLVPLLVEAGVPTDTCNVANRRMSSHELNRSNLTPMGLAAVLGQLSCLRRLHGCGVSIVKTDRRKRTPLMLASRDGQLHVVQYLLHHGVDARAVDSSGNTAAHYAAAYGWLHILKLLVDCGADANAVATWKGTPLSCASLKNQKECTDYLVSVDGVDLNVRDSFGRTIIANLAQVPTAEGLEQLRFLIESGAHVNIADTAGRTALHHVCTVATAENNPTCQRLIQNFVSVLLDAGADINVKDNDGLTPLMCAIQNVNVKAVQQLLSQGAALDGNDCQGRNILHMVAERIDQKNTGLLLKKIVNTHGVNAIVNNLDKGQLCKTPLLLALSTPVSHFGAGGSFFFFHQGVNDKVEQQQHKVQNISLLLSMEGLKLDVAVQKKMKKGDESDPMGEEEEDTMDEDVSEHSSDDDDDDEDTDWSENDHKQVGWTCMHFLAKAEDVFKPILAKAVERGANVDIRAANGKTPLHVAIEAKNEWAVVELIKAKARADLADNTGSTSLHLACHNWADAPFIEDLINLGSVTSHDKHSRTALHYATLSSSIKACRLLLSRGADANFADDLGRTPLHYAVSQSSRTTDASSDLEQLLLSHNARVNELDHFGRSPLHYAFVPLCLVDKEMSDHSNNDLDIKAKTLVAESSSRKRIDPIETVSSMCAVDGILPDQVDELGRAPLHYAAQVSALTSSLYLLSRGAELNREDKEHNTPLALALSSLNPDYSVLIMQKGANVLKKIHTVCKKDNGTDDQTIQAVSTFYHAVRHDWLGVSYMILDTGFPPFEAIRDAMSTGKYQLTLTLMGKLKDDVLSSYDSAGCSLLHWLCRSAASELPENVSAILEKLVRAGCSPHEADKNGFTPLHYAAERCAVRLVGDLLDVHKCDVNSLDEDGNSPLVLALKGPFSVVNLHSSEKAVAHVLGRGLSSDAKEKRPSSEYVSQMVDLLLKHSASPTGQYEDPSYDDGLTTLLIHCIRQSESSLVKLLLDADGEVATEVDGLGRSPIMHAVIMNNYDMAKKLRPCSDLSHQDLQGRSVVHYVVQPLQYGSYENAKLLDFLAAARAPLEIRDSDGRTPMQYAAMQDSGMMVNCLKKHGLEILPSLCRMQTELHKFEADQFSIDEDSSAFLTASVVKEKVEPVVDMQFEGRKTSMVYTDDQGVIFDVLLNKVDVSYGSFGLNNYYKMQVLHESVQDVYFVWTHWGRWGDGPGMFQRTPFNTAQEAMIEFQKIFKSKTGNEWQKAAAGEFVALPKKYKMLPVERVQHRVKQLLAPFDLNKAPPSHLPPQLRETLCYLTDVSVLCEKGRSEGLEKPEAALRFGHMSEELLSNGRAILDELAPLIKETSGMRYQPNANVDTLLKLNERMVELSNRYYELLPQIHSCFGKSGGLPVMVITQPAHLKAARQQLRKVTDFSITARIILAAWHRRLTINPLDYCYRSLHAVLDPLATGSLERNVVEAYMLATGGHSTKRFTVENVFKLERRGEPQRMTQWSSMKNHRLLWHGSPSSNLLSILSLGLLLTRAEPDMANDSDLASIWNGLYFADMFDKSINYTAGRRVHHRSRQPFSSRLSSSTSKPRLYVLLCEVALGEIMEVDSSNSYEVTTLAKGKDSMLLCGREGPDWSHAITLPNGVQIPLGGVARPQQRTVQRKDYSGWWPYNEYVIGDESRVRMRYVIELSEKEA